MCKVRFRTLEWWPRCCYLPCTRKRALEHQISLSFQHQSIDSVNYVFHNCGTLFHSSTIPPRPLPCLGSSGPVPHTWWGVWDVNWTRYDDPTRVMMTSGKVHLSRLRLVSYGTRVPVVPLGISEESTTKTTVLHGRSTYREYVSLLPVIRRTKLKLWSL